MNQRMLARWLKTVAVLVCAIFAAFFFYMVPRFVTNTDRAMLFGFVPSSPEMATAFLIAVECSVIPCFATVMHFFRIASNIGRDQSFCMENARRLMKISRWTLVDIAWCALITVVFAVLDTIHLRLIGIALGIMLVGSAFAGVVSVLSHLAEKAARLKEENDLTV